MLGDEGGPGYSMGHSFSESLGRALDFCHANQGRPLKGRVIDWGVAGRIPLSSGQDAKIEDGAARSAKSTTRER